MKIWRYTVCSSKILPAMPGVGSLHLINAQQRMLSAEDVQKGHFQKSVEARSTLLNVQ